MPTVGGFSTYIAEAYNNELVSTEQDMCSYVNAKNKNVLLNI